MRSFPLRSIPLKVSTQLCFYLIYIVQIASAENAGEKLSEWQEERFKILQWRSFKWQNQEEIHEDWTEHSQPETWMEKSFKGCSILCFRSELIKHLLEMEKLNDSFKEFHRLSIWKGLNGFQKNVMYLCAGLGAASYVRKNDFNFLSNSCHEQIAQ